MNGIAGDGGRASNPYAVYILALLLIGNALSYADRQLFAILAPAIKAEFGLNDSFIGVLGGPAFMVSFVVCSFPLARLADRWSRRKVLAISIGLWSAMTAACGLTANAASLALARVGVGVGEAGGSPASQAIIATLFQPERRSAALGMFASGTFFGALAAMLGGAVLAEHAGWRLTFVFFAAPGAILALLMWFTGPRRQHAPQAQASTKRVLQRCWSMPTFRYLCLGAGMAGIFGYVTATWMPSYLMRSHGISLVETGFWIGTGATVGGLSGTLAGGALVDRLSRRDSRWQLYMPALGIGCSIPLFVLQLLVPAKAVIVVGSLTAPLAVLPTPFSAFLTALWLPAGFSAAANLVPSELRSQSAALLIISLTVIGAGLGPVMVGVLSDLLNASAGEESLRYAMLASSVSLLCSSVAFWRGAAHYPADVARRETDEPYQQDTGLSPDSKKLAQQIV